MFDSISYTQLTDGEIVIKLEGITEENKSLGHVKSYKFYITKYGQTDTIIGKIDLRVGHNEQTYYGGNIGYEIYKPHRGNYFAGKACKLIKHIALAHNMKHLYITCDTDHVASMKTCEYAGFTYLKTVTLPQNSPFYHRHHRQKCIYEWKM